MVCLKKDADPGLKVRIRIGQKNPDPSGSGSETLVNTNPDPDHSFHKVPDAGKIDAVPDPNLDICYAVDPLNIFVVSCSFFLTDGLSKNVYSPLKTFPQGSTSILT